MLVGAASLQRVTRLLERKKEVLSYQNERDEQKWSKQLARHCVCERDSKKGKETYKQCDQMAR